MTSDPSRVPPPAWQPFASLRVLGATAQQVLSRFALSVGANLVALLFSLPMILVAGLATFGSQALAFFPIAVAVLIGVLPNPAAMGLHSVMRDVAHNELPELKDQRDGLQRYWRVGLRAWLLGLAGTLVAAGNFAFYAVEATDRHSALHGISVPAAIIWFFILLLWFSFNFYVAPLLLAQEQPSMRLAYRNAAVLVLQRPLYSWLLVTAWLAVLLATAGTGLIVLIGLSLAACLQENALKIALRE